MERWNGKVAVVTGASSGIGKAIVEKLVQNGMRVAGLARQKNKVDDLAVTLKDEKGKLYAIQVDMTIEEEILKAFAYVVNNIGPIHVLVNSAGVCRVAPIASGKTERWREVMETNVIGLCIATREAVQNMILNNVQGHIIHLNSVVGHSSRLVSLDIYGASKFAVTSLTDSLREEMSAAKTNIKITSISPGYVETGMLDRVAKESDGLLSEENVKNFRNNNSALNAEDVADSALYALGTPPHVQVHEIIIRPMQTHRKQ